MTTREDFHKVIRACGVIIDADNKEEWNKNENNSDYQACYKRKGFNWAYWTSEETYDSSGAWIVGFLRGNGVWAFKSFQGYVRCVR